MGNYSLIQLVQDSFPTVSIAAAKLASQKASVPLGKLGANLCLFTDATRQFSIEKKRFFEKDIEFIQTISDLDRIIAWPEASLRKVELPSLRAIAVAHRQVDEGNRDGIANLKILEAKVCQSLVKKKINLNEITEALNTWLDISADDEIEYFDSTDLAQNALKSYAKHAKTVHAALCSYSLCVCSTQEKFDQHWARLRLKPDDETKTDRAVPFDIAFSVTPNPLQAAICEWQVIQVLASSNDASSKRVKFVKPTPAPAPPAPPALDDRDDVERSLCKFISSQCASVLRFEIERGRLMALREPDDTQFGQTLGPDRGLHLGEMLRTFKMRHGMRPVIAYIIAQSVWHFYDSDWMNVEWMTSSIYFINELSAENNEVAYYCKPYLNASFKNTETISPEYKEGLGIMHRYPRLLALGMILLEIATGQSIASEGHPDQWNAQKINQQLTRLTVLLKTSRFEDDCNYPHYKASVEKCLNIGLFKNAPFNPKSPKENLEERRSILYNEVVDPLKQLFEGTGWRKTYHEIEQTPIIPKRKFEYIEEPLALPTTIEKEKSNINSHTTPALNTGYKHDYWLTKIAAINRHIKELSKKAPKRPRIKIAILDTGCDGNAPTFDIPGKTKRIKKWKDFVSNSPDMIDSDGHGTHLITLLLQIAPEADIYIARIAENSAGLNGSENNISEAIRTAALDWNVDFVSMSFGFNRHVEEIEQAISHAVYHKKKTITFFAAAANDGLNSREMFPANLGEFVISIRGTTREGAFETKFNPPTLGNELVFGTLGVDVSSDWIEDEYTRSLSGCSVATPIAVGIAALLFDFVATQPEHFDTDELRLIRTRRGVFELFNEIGIESGNNRRYIAPFDLFQSTTGTRLARVKAAIGRHPERW